MNNNSMLYLRRAVEVYTGYTVEHLEYVMDPNVPGTYAIKARFYRRKKNQPDSTYLYRVPKHTRLSEVDPKEAADLLLEEVEFSCWPPTHSGGLLA